MLGTELGSSTVEVCTKEFSVDSGWLSALKFVLESWCVLTPPMISALKKNHLVILWIGQILYSSGVLTF